ncbi:phosphorylase [Methylocella sp.]|uniref:phosphorylase family protein n=1 Tax=Methylocella sp. TaxID=1978226 RepID=UPI0037847972
MSEARRPLVVAVGLKAEARVAARIAGARVVAGGGDSRRLALALESACAGACGVLSFGIAGGLDPALAPGTSFLAREVVAPDGTRFPADARLVRALGLPDAVFAGVDAAVGSADEKRTLRLATGASLVDMESHVAAQAAARFGLPFAALRVVADPAGAELPHAALVAMRPDGGIALSPLLRSLARDPRQIVGLTRAAFAARAAFKSLFRGGQALALGLPDFGELVLDMPAEDEFGRPLSV